MRVLLPFFKVSSTGSSNPYQSLQGDKTWVFLCLDLRGLRKNRWGKAPSPSRKKPQAWREKILLAPAGSSPRA